MKDTDVYADLAKASYPREFMPEARTKRDPQSPSTYLQAPISDDGLMHLCNSFTFFRYQCDFVLACISAFLMENIVRESPKKITLIIRAA